MAAASARAWGGVGYLVVFGSLVGFTAFAYCLNELPATTVGTYAYVNPMVAVALGALVLGEPLTPGLLAGGLADRPLRGPHHAAQATLAALDTPPGAGRGVLPSRARPSAGGTRSRAA